MRIVLATTALDRGGVWRHIEDLGNGLAAAGHAVVVGLLPDAQRLQRAAYAAGLRSAPWRRTLLWRDVVWHGHVHDTFDLRFLLAAALRSTIGPTVLTEHLPRTNASDEWLLPGPRRPGARICKTAFKRAQLRLADAVIAVSDSSAGFIVTRYRADPSRIAIVPNGVADDEAHVNMDAWEAGAMRVLCVGALNMQKGQDRLISAAAQAHQRWSVTFAGAGPGEERLRAQARELDDRIEFTGWREDVAALMARSDVVCVPSRWESFGYVALEAMAAARPVVAFEVDGLRELVEDGVTGLLVRPDDPAELASALDRLASDAALRRRMGAAALRRARDHFTLEEMVSRTLAVYSRAVQHGAPG